MKKLTKIFATVLTLSMAMSTVIMPTTAEAAYDNAHINLTFSTAADATTLTNATGPAGEATTRLAGFGGKDATDMVGQINMGTSYRYYLSTNGIEGASGVMTYEAQVYLDGTQRIAHVYDGSGSSYRIAMKFRTDGSVVTGSTLGTDDSIWTSLNGSANHGTYTSNSWNKFAIVWDSVNGEVKFYLNGSLINTEIITKETSTRTTFNAQFAFEGATGLKVDNMRIYPEAYVPANDTMPIQATGLSFIEGDMTVAEAKAFALDTQAGGPAVVKVYKDGIGGTEAADTETLGKDWYVVITSISGDLYRADGIYRVSSKLNCTGVTYADSTVTATVVNNGSPIESMMMVLVEDGGKFIMSSEVATNVTSGATFTITGVDSLSNAEVFFVESWADLAPVMDSTFEVE